MFIVFGTRPEAIKLAPVISLLRKDSAIDLQVIFTGQHRTLAASIFEHFGIEIDRDLEIMTHGQSSSEIAARVLMALDPIIKEKRPNWIVVQGDTTSAVAAAMAGFYGRVAVAHLEAGLRSGVADDPFPEEMNRRLISRLASLHFVPTERNRSNLLAEGIDDNIIRVTGNTVIDAMESILAEDEATMLPAIARAVASRNNRLVLLTTHRRENFGEGQRGIFEAIGDIVAEHADIEVVYPMHPNPAVTEGADEYLPHHERIHRIEPVDYPRFVHLMSHAWLVMTDSGGLQEEAPALGIPTLVLRRTTERPELIESGSGEIVGIDRTAIVAAVRRLSTDSDLYTSMSQRRFPFGTGGAAAKITASLS